MTLTTDPAFTEKLATYPATIAAQMRELRELVHTVAGTLPSVSTLHETLKWGEPAFVTKHGSTLRMDWKPKRPDRYALYFSCSSELVPTFRVVYGEELRLEGNRALLLDPDRPLPLAPVRECIRMALEYHRIKHLPLLGK